MLACNCYYFGLVVGSVKGVIDVLFWFDVLFVLLLLCAVCVNFYDDATVDCCVSLRCVVRVRVLYFWVLVFCRLCVLRVVVVVVVFCCCGVVVVSVCRY